MIRVREIADRHSTRSFRPDPVSEEDILELVEAACAAPSSKNQQRWHMVRMDGDDLHRFAELMEEHFRSESYEGPRGGPVATMRVIRQAPVGLFVFSDEPVDSEMRTPAVQSVGAAIQNILVEAQARGISSLWCCDMLYAYDFAYSLIGGPGELMAAVILGYEDEPSPRKRHKTPDEVLEHRTLRDES